MNRKNVVIGKLKFILFIYLIAYAENNISYFSNFVNTFIKIYKQEEPIKCMILCIYKMLCDAMTLVISLQRPDQ